MVERIIEYSARNRFIVFLLVIAFSVVGLWAMWQTPIDAPAGYFRHAGHRLHYLARTLARSC